MRLRSLRYWLAHDLATAEAYQATYAGQPPATDPWIRAGRAANDREVEQLRARMAALDPESGATDG